ncbi:MAG: hypothetical protein Q8L24_01840, partial [bacterium]|nr:hypothetical protein [bacterium]
DAYRRQQKLKEITETFTGKHGNSGLERFDLSVKGEIERLKDFTTTQSLFDSSKLGIIYEVAEVDPPKAINELLKIADGSKTISLAVVAGKALPKTFKIIYGADVVSQEFSDLPAAQLSVFAKTEAQKQNFKLSDSLLQSLIWKYAKDTWGLVNEIERLALGGSPETVLREQDFFSAINQLEYGKTASAKLPVLERLMHSEESAKIFNILAAMARDKNKMADYDLAIKSGKLEYEEVLTAIATSD